MNKLKNITRDEAIDFATNTEAPAVYMLVRLYGDTTLDDLIYSDGFYVMEEVSEPKKKGGVMKPADHGRIVALYTANPPRSVKWIADDMKISQQTVINHLKKEGIYDPEK